MSIYLFIGKLVCQHSTIPDSQIRAVYLEWEVSCRRHSEDFLGVKTLSSFQCASFPESRQIKYCYWFLILTTVNIQGIPEGLIGALH